MAIPDRRTLRRRLAWFAGSLLLIAALAASFWFGRPAPPPPAEPVVEVPAPPPPPPPPLVRADLGLPELSAAVEAALLPPLQGAAPPPQILGQRFTIVLPFGCTGPVEGADAPLGYTLDAEQGAITLTARPEKWAASALVRAISAPGEYEAVEGFWVQPNPAAAQACPPGPAAESALPAAASAESADTAAAAAKETETDAEKAAESAGDKPPAPPPRIGLARFFPAGSSRAEQRRDRPYRVTRKVAEPATAFPKGFLLSLSGRVADGEAGPVIRCGAPASTAAPECLIAVEFDRVAFEDAATGEVLAQWGS